MEQIAAWKKEVKERDNAMADNKNPAQTPIYESQESLYEKAVKKMNADKLIVQFAFKIENYQVAAAMFEEVGEFKDAPELAKKCRQLAEITKAEQIEDLYAKASERKEKCKTIKDYKAVADLFDNLGTYKESEQGKKFCLEQISFIEKKKSARRNKGISGIVILFAMIVGGYFSGFFHYAVGMGCYVTGEYKTAEEIFIELGGFLDSEEKLEQCKNELQKEKDEAEKQKLIHAKVGSEFKYGTHTWKVLEREGNHVYMIATQVDYKSEFYHVPFHNAQDPVDWEDSALRQWLNSEVLESIFSEEERSRLVTMKTEETVNNHYGTKDRKEVEDYIRILSIEEAEKYEKILKTLGLDYWLRTPGHEEGTVAYYSAGHAVMDYGYPVSSEQISVRPVITVDCSGLKED